MLDNAIRFTQKVLTVGKEQIFALVEKPKRMPGGKVLFKHDLNYNVK